MKARLNPQYWSGQLTNTVIGLLGIILILVSIIIGIEKTFSVVLISVGTSILASAVVSYLGSKYLVCKNEFTTMMEYWGIEAIYETRAEINRETNALLKNVKTLDICAMGLKGFRDSQESEILKRISEGMRLRILTLNPNSKFLSIIDETEGLANGATKVTIESLLTWVSDLKKSELFDRQVEIKTYDHYPYDFYFCLDGTVFTGPYQDKTSQQTITYKFTMKGNGSKYYTQYYESLWNDNHGEI